MKIVYFICIVLLTCRNICGDVSALLRRGKPLVNVDITWFTLHHKPTNFNTLLTTVSFEKGLQVKQNVLPAVTNLSGGYISALSNCVNSLEVQQTKLILQVVITTFNVLCWLIPLRNTNFTKTTEMLSLANSFSGGVFLMLSFGHMIPHAIEQMVSLGQPQSRALMCALGGYLLMFAVEKMAFDHSHNHDHSNNTKLDTKGCNSILHTSSAATNINTATDLSARLYSLPSLNSAVLLCAALSAHSFFEAASLGLATDTTSAIVLAACIVLHQPAESVALLVAFLKSGMPTRSVVLWLLTYSGMTLIGHAAGRAVGRFVSPSLEPLIAAVTAGTFFYVGATETVSEEFGEEATFAQRARRFVAYLGGLAVMGAVVAAGSRLEGNVGHAH